MDPRTPRETVEAYLDAIQARDFQRVRECLSNERFSNRSPISFFDNADAFVADIARVGPILEGIERRRMFVDGDYVCTVVNYITRMDQRTVTPVVHVMQIENGRIHAIETFFDARGYEEMFQIG